MLKWIKRNGSECLSIMAILLSSIALLRCDPFVFAESSLSWMLGITVSIIGLGVTTLLGVQIYNAMTIDKLIDKKLDTMRLDLNNEIDDASDENKEISLCMNLFNLGMTQSVSKDHNLAFDSIVLSITRANRMNFHEFSSMALSILLNYMNELFSKGFILHLTKAKKSEYKQGLLGIKDEKLGELISIINSALEV